MTTTKKILAAIDPKSGKPKLGDFLIPWRSGDVMRLMGLKSGTFFDSGVMVYLGRDISVNDVFSKLVDRGQKISNVAETLAMLEAYLLELKSYQVGNSLALESADGEKCKLRLVTTPSRSKPLNLP